ncbi:GntR family transcriptional regulator [Pandoraea communis]|uniref:GntR family transcriptional regulator n=1 Tax=Pandoraea communis TaxID=2508297 RepID=A0A5E4Z2J3_9BURK|nr:GntR family transcriptional regulator [Pandoraea communis]VVE54540.1 GntR family transcriptional regulator [Pandoraea communis]
MARKGTGKTIENAQDKLTPGATHAKSLYRTFIDAIVDQRLLPGTRLNELAMSKLFDVSRREMGHLFTRLECEGLVVSIQNRGAFVASPDALEARAIFGARKSIEAGIVELAATRASGADFKVLEKSIADEDALRRAGRMREAIKESGRFHLLLADIAGNAILADLVKQLVARTSLVTSLYDNASGMSCWHDDHGKLIGHLRARRTKRAIDIMRQHLDDLEASLDLSVKIGSKADLRTIFGLPSEQPKK